MRVCATKPGFSGPPQFWSLLSAAWLLGISTQQWLLKETGSAGDTAEFVPRVPLFSLRMHSSPRHLLESVLLSPSSGFRRRPCNAGSAHPPALVWCFHPGNWSEDPPKQYWQVSTPFHRRRRCSVVPEKVPQTWLASLSYCSDLPTVSGKTNCLERSEKRGSCSLLHLKDRRTPRTGHSSLPVQQGGLKAPLRQSDGWTHQRTSADGGQPHPLKKTYDVIAF